MKTIILILAAIATMSFAMCLDAQGQRLPLPEGQADSRIPLPAQFRASVEKGIITLRDVNSGKVMGRTTFERWGVVTPTQDNLRHVADDRARCAGRRHYCELARARDAERCWASSL